MPNVGAHKVMSFTSGELLRKHLSRIREKLKTLFDEHWAGNAQPDETGVAIAWNLWSAAGIEEQTNSTDGDTEVLKDEIVKMMGRVDAATARRRMAMNFWLGIRRIQKPDGDHTGYRRHLNGVKAGLLRKFGMVARELREKFNAQPRVAFMDECEALRTIAVALRDVQVIQQSAVEEDDDGEDSESESSLE
ncbi:hypothetical protein EJ03DRAFT_347734 [Teratosphaeria nubilosa]|uniref:Uncharacterized protein n=1 Tax=Teratosphaeria nubilosa TaxID=161662 RepID=A0A6G1LJR7_9PEZI|nr:hypothetical protein EJ03DRAFT_347734 [Teratosphaeria nubilosa]